MVRQVITVHQGGAISGLDREGLIDFKQLGRARVERTSSILWNSVLQKWYVHFLHLGRMLESEDGTLLLFDSYKEAQAAEVAYLDALRLQGKIPKLT